MGPQSDPRPEPEHSVPLGARPRLLDRDDAVGFENPVPSTPQSIARGRTLFHERCAPCHGFEGHGGGPVAKVFPPAPDLRYPVIAARDLALTAALFGVGYRYTRRLAAGWGVLYLLLYVFFISRLTKRARGTLAFGSAVVLAGLLIERFVLVLPPLEVPGGAASGVLAVLIALGTFGLFVATGSPRTT